MDMPVAGAALHRMEFRGQAGEYFRIWIVNVVLTVLTLGIYSAWAKVRTNRYFYRNTVLDGVSFDYLASPITILKGRLILAAGVVVYIGVGYVNPLAQLGVMLLIGLMIPWIIQRALRFRLGNTGYRNLRFHFVGTVGESYAVSLKGLLAAVFSLGFAAPWGLWLRQKYAVDNARYGTSAFKLNTRSGPFFKAYFGAAAIVILAVVIAGIGIGALSSGMQDMDERSRMLFVNLGMWLVLLPAYLFSWAFYEATVAKATIDTMTLDEHAFRTDITASGLAWVVFSSGVGIILSLGILLPWAKVRIARYRLTRVQMLPAGELSAFVADQNAQIGAAGDEVGAYLDLDLGI